jgi:hypothetical protein
MPGASRPRVFVEAQYVAETLRYHDAEFQQAIDKARKGAERAMNRTLWA